MGKKTLESGKLERDGVRKKVRELIQQIEQIWADRTNTDPDTTILTICSHKLQKYETKLEELDSLVESKLDDEDLDAEYIFKTSFTETLWETTSKINIMFDEHANKNSAKNDDTNSAAGSRHSAQAAATVKLPKLELRLYNGDHLKWQEFWDSFESTIHQNDQLSDIDKFKYLKSLLSEEALRVVDGFRLTAANYDPVLQTLKDRFGNPEVAVFAHFDRLLSLSIPSMETSKLQATYDECEKHIRSLVALGLSEDTFGQVFTPIILSKLPRPIRVELHRRNGSDAWKLSSLRSYMRDEIKAREMSDRSFADSSKFSKEKEVPSVKPNPSQSKTNFNQSKQNFVPQWSPGRQNSRPFQQSRLPSASALAQTSGQSIECCFCKGAHYADQCKKYQTLDSRKSMIKGHCFKCLSATHMINQCRRQNHCYYCKGTSHHSSLCPTKFGQSSNSAKMCNSQTPHQTDNKSEPQMHAGATGGQSIMQMAQINLDGIQRPVRVFFDNGSSRSYVTNDLASSLGLKREAEETISIAKFGDSKRSTVTYKKVKLSIPTKSGSVFEIYVLSTPTISCPIQKLPIDVERHPILKQVDLADPPSNKVENVSIDILVGMDYYYHIVGSERIDLDDGLILLNSKLGYITTGNVKLDDEETCSFLSVMLKCTEARVAFDSVDLEKFWSLEDIGVKDDCVQTDDELAISKFNETIKFTDGRYEVGFPWKDSSPDLPTNYTLAQARLRQLLKRMSSNNTLLAAYNDTIQTQLREGIIEVAPSVPDGETVHYIPHHCVVKPHKDTTKLRIVYDASAKARKDLPSLNDCLLRGPVLLEDLCGLLLRFRTHPIGIVSDMEKAFLQIFIRKSDRDVIRFIWVKDISKPPTSDNIIIFRICRVPFGVISSPFLLLATLRHHLNHQGSAIANDCASNIYVDNIVTGRGTVSEALSCYADTKALFNPISMNVREWYSNCNELMESIPINDRGQNRKPGVLGMVWDTSHDTLSCNDVKIDNVTVNSKRQLLQVISRIFDPCGFFSPVVIRCKLLIQDLWRAAANWDDALPIDVSDQWLSQAADIQEIQYVPIARCVKPADLPNGTKFELHCFCDASGKAYASAIYLRYVKPDGRPESNLLFSKTRLAPLKSISIPKLELMAAAVGIRMCQFVIKQLGLTIHRTVLWSDSDCVLQWINSKKNLPVFVKNRVRDILKLPNVEFRYVPTGDNPADIPSRGCSLNDLRESKKWWSGPPFLMKAENEWPRFDPSQKPIQELQLFSEQKTTAAPVTPVVPEPFGIILANYSSLSKLLRVTSYVIRFVLGCRVPISKLGFPFGQNRSCSKEISAAEMDQALQVWVVFAQTSFQVMDANNFELLQRQLNLIKDKYGIFRCHGRLQNSDLPFESKFPAILPKNHAFTKLVIRNCHERLRHAGPRHTLADIRSRFWIPHGKSQVQSVLKDCVKCRKLEGGPFASPPFPPLPDFRVSQSVPFSFCGVDYLGPLFIKSSESEQKKVWICLFTCAAIRAVHLEVVEDMTTHQFLLGLRRFTSNYGRPKMIISDNGTYFKMAHDVLKQTWAEIFNSSAVQQLSASEGIEWKFIPELSPWMGGFYERLIGSVKRSLKKALGHHCVDLVQLQTIAAEVAAIVNSRPLILADDVNDTTLTPAHLLGRGGRPVGFPGIPVNSEEFQLNVNPRSQQVLEYWRASSKLLDNFWQIWRNDYLTSLREVWRNRKTRNASVQHPEVGGIVLLKDNLPRTLWKVARITRLTVSKDGLCRSVQVRLANGRILNRPVKLLYPIESAVAENATSKQSAVQPDSRSPQSITIRPKRKAARAAETAIKQMACDDQFSDSN